METVLQEIKNERARQDMKWGQQNHEPEMWLSILGEEFGEVCKAVCEARFSGYASTGDWSQYRIELIQVAAVACAMVECFDRSRSWKDCLASVTVMRPDFECDCEGPIEEYVTIEGLWRCKKCGGNTGGMA